MDKLIKGCYRDLLSAPHGEVLWDSGWRSNKIVRSCNLLLAALMKRHEGMAGILYWAVGEGEGVWDSSCPAPLSITTRLTREVARHAVAADQIVYLDSTGEQAGTITPWLEVTSEFTMEDLGLNGSTALREFGLFGGDATEAPNSGFMIDYVIHPRIDLTPGMKLSRKLRMSFMVDVVQKGDLTGFGATLPVVSIDGVGPEYGSALMDNHIHILSDLASVNPLVPIGNIPQVKLREFRAKARMVTGLRISLPSLEKWSDMSISRFLMENPGDLAGLVGTQEVTPAMVIQLQEELAALQIALDDAQLQSITLSDLMNP